MPTASRTGGAVLVLATALVALRPGASFTGSAATLARRPAPLARRFAAEGGNAPGPVGEEDTIFPDDHCQSPALSRFITQRAVQLLNYYYALNLDTTKHIFLSEFLMPEREGAPVLDENYHGINGLPTTTSAEYVCRIFVEPEWEVEIKKEMGCAPGKGHGGLRPDGTPMNRAANPYLTPRYFSYWDTITPSDIAHRLLSIRDKVSRELHRDAQVFVDQNEAQLIDGSFHAVAGSTQFRLQLEFLEGAANSTPFRVSNFDLFRLLVTREAIVRLIGRLSLDDRDAADWLQEFSAPWLAKFDQPHRWERGDRVDVQPMADEFMIALSECEEPGARDLAMLLLKQRATVAEDWRVNLRSDVEKEHVEWQRWQMSRVCLGQGYSLSDDECPVP